MRLYEICILLILLILFIKSISPLVMMFVKFNDEKLKFNIKIKKESIQKMSALEFEGFCRWLFEEDPNFKNIELTPSFYDGDVDLIITTLEDEQIYVECKRYDLIEAHDGGKLVTKEDLDFTIGREICQKLVGAMVANNIKTGYIITTGSIHANALEYMSKLKANSNINLQFFTMTDIVEIIECRKDKKEYSFALEI